MRKYLCLWATMMMCGLMVTTSCKHNMDDYVKKPYTVSDSERLSYAEKTLNTTIDKQQNWVLTNQYNVKVTADANLEGIKAIAILDGNPFIGSTNMRLTRCCMLPASPVTSSSLHAPSCQERMLPYRLRLRAGRWLLPRL